MPDTSRACSSLSEDHSLFARDWSIMVETIQGCAFPRRCFGVSRSHVTADRQNKTDGQLTMNSSVASKSLLRVFAMVTFHAATSRFHWAPGIHAGTCLRNGNTSTRYLPGVYALSMILTDASARLMYSSLGFAGLMP